MSYLLIKDKDVKTFKAFISGREVELGVSLSSNANVFRTGEEVEILYGNDFYKAKINQKKMLEPKGQSDQSMVKLSVLKR
jgi:hypothetical protein